MKKSNKEKKPRKKLITESLINDIKIVGAFVGIIAGAICIISAAFDQSDDSSGSSDNILIDDFKRCSNCGNDDESTLYDEGDTLYCSQCGHRTLIETLEDDIVECPFCHRLRDRKALYCRYCNDSSWRSSSKTEFDEIDKILRENGE